LNLRPSGYEPDELPGCSTPRQVRSEEEAYGTDLSGPGGDLLSRVLRQSTIGAEAFDGRVRDGIGSYRLAEGHQAGEDQFDAWRDLAPLLRRLLKQNWICAHDV
jgi:hypothetical protein